MNEGEWLVCTSPTHMFELVQTKTTDRKLRLLAVACSRSIWPLLTDERSRRAVELAEQSADQPVPQELLDTVSGEAEEAFEEAITNDEATDEKTGANAAQLLAACSVASYASNSPGVRGCDALEVMQAAAEAAFDYTAERASQARIMHDIFGNPFRTPRIDPGVLDWNDGTVVKMAQGIYDDRAFDRLPVLADALEEAGCRDFDIIAHCRHPGPHVRGCWLIDLLTGKE